MPLGRDEERRHSEAPSTSPAPVWAPGTGGEPPLSSADAPADVGRVRVRTLIAIRWIMIGLQIIAVAVAGPILGLDLAMAPLASVIATSIAINILATRQRRFRSRLTDRDATAYLAYDILQLGLVLWLTGGTQNPFAVLLLVPVAVGSSILPRDHVVMLVAWSTVLVTILALNHAPLPVPNPSLTVGIGYTIAIWLAICLSAVFIAVYVWRVAHENRRMAEAFLESQIALARAKQASALGALAAASAHEMGTPLATITVVAREIERELPPDSPMREDFELILQQAERCRDSLATLAQHPETSGGDPYERLTLEQLIQEAATPHRFGKIDFELTADGLDGSPEPRVGRSPELLHGLGNLTQNALQFAAERVEVVATWSHDEVLVEIIDDGPGFPVQILETIGEPYQTTRSQEGGHLGLGIFIATTLLDRTGAKVGFANRAEGGAQVVIRWNRVTFEVQR